MADDSSIDEQPSYHIASAHSTIWHAINGRTKDSSYDYDLDLSLACTHAAIAQAMLLERIERHLAVIAEHLTVSAQMVTSPEPVHYG